MVTTVITQHNITHAHYLSECLLVLALTKAQWLDMHASFDMEPLFCYLLKIRAKKLQGKHLRMVTLIIKQSLVRETGGKLTACFMNLVNRYRAA